MKATETKSGPTEFLAEIERLKTKGKMPSLENVLDALVEIRREYAPRILQARFTNSALRTISRRSRSLMRT